MPSLRELKAVFQTLTKGTAKSKPNRGMFWSGDNVVFGDGVVSGEYLADSMKSSHTLSRMLKFTSLEMTDAGYSAERHSEFQYLGELIERFLKAVDPKALLESEIFELKDSQGKSLIELEPDLDKENKGKKLMKVKGVSPGKWWDVASTNFALGQEGIVWCTHATDHDSYWATTEDLLGRKPKPINVTWVNKEYPALIQGLEQGRVTGIVEIYNDKIMVAHRGTR